MRSVLFIIGLLFSSVVYSQYSWTPAVVTLKNGNVLTGEAEISQATETFDLSGTEELKFRAEGKSKKQKYEIQEVANVLFTTTYIERVNGERIEKVELTTFVPVLLKKTDSKDYLGFMQEVVAGGVSLYGRTVFQRNGDWRPGSNGPIFMGYWSQHNQLWVSRDGEEATVINHTSLFKDFNNRATEYFKNCPSLVAKLKGKDLKQSEIKKIVKFYNDTCS